MTFLHATLAAAGIACVAIPIIIHLLMHRRRKPVIWGAMRFLLEAYRRQRRRLMLEKWLLLLCRCLVLGLLGLAIGRPLLGTLGGEKSGRTLYLLIDNGLSSALKADGDQGKTALDRHKEAAKAAVAALREARGPGGALGEGDRVGLIAMGGPAEGLVVPPSADLASLANIIDEIEPTDSRTDLNGAMQIVADSLTRSGAEASGAYVPDPKRTYVAVFSDFREGSLELSPGTGGAGAVAAGVRLPAGVTLTATRPGQEAAATNVSIASVEPLRSVVVGEAGDQAGADLARVQLRRSGGDLAAATSTVTARVVAANGGNVPGTGETKGAGDAAVRAIVKWTAGQDSAMTVVSIPRPQGTGASGAAGRGGSCVVVVTIENDSLARDNTWRRPVEFRESLRVGVVGPTRFASAGADKLDPAAWARLALSPAGEAAASGIEVVDIEPASVDAARLAGLDALVLPRPDLLQDSSWVRVGLFLSSGGVVVVMPPPNLAVHLWTDAMSKGLGLPSEWTLPRESRNVEGARLVAESAAPAGTEGSGSGDAKAGNLLSLVQGEMDELLRPVNIRTVLPLESTGEIGHTLLRLENGPTILWAGRPGAGAAAGGAERRNEPGLLVYLGVALSLDWSDLPAKPLMVPLMQEAIRQGVGEARGTWWSVAGSRPVAPARTVELREIPVGEGVEAPGQPRTVAVDETGAVVQPLRRGGAFRAVDERGATRALVAVNPDGRGSKIGVQTIEAVGKQLRTAVTGEGGAEGGADKGNEVVWIPASPGAAGGGPVTAESVQRTFAGMFGGGPKGSPLDLPLLLAALALAVVEVGLARWASHADVQVAAKGGGVVATVGADGRAAA